MCLQLRLLCSTSKHTCACSPAACVYYRIWHRVRASLLSVCQPASLPSMGACLPACMGGCMQLEEDFIKANPEWVTELELMLRTKEKAEIQAREKESSGACMDVHARAPTNARNYVKCLCCGAFVRRIPHPSCRQARQDAPLTPTSIYACMPARWSTQRPCMHACCEASGGAAARCCTGAVVVWLPIPQPGLPAAQAAGGRLDLRRSSSSSRLIHSRRALRMCNGTDAGGGERDINSRHTRTSHAAGGRCRRRTQDTAGWCKCIDGCPNMHGIC